MSFFTLQDHLFSSSSCHPTISTTWIIFTQSRKPTLLTLTWHGSQWESYFMRTNMPYFLNTSHRFLLPTSIRDFQVSVVVLVPSHMIFSAGRIITEKAYNLHLYWIMVYKSWKTSLIPISHIIFVFNFKHVSYWSSWSSSYIVFRWFP